jgi:hypothetical protein
MYTTWQQYQERVAECLRSFGFEVAIEAQVHGARGTHVIDVLATRVLFGVPTTWIAECKLWNRAVSKEKVLVLNQVAADVGADRAFLFSESGFQSGAISAVRNTNITLINLEDLCERGREEVDKAALQDLAREAHRLQSRGHDAFDPRLLPGDRGERILSLLSCLFELKTIAIPKAQSSEYPVPFGGSWYPNAPSFIEAAETEIERLSAVLDEQPRPTSEFELPLLVESFLCDCAGFS